jgi:hypothetical protein
MTAQQAGALLLISGSVVFCMGAAIGVPRVRMRDCENGLGLLTENLARWRSAQPLYALGPLMTAAGVGFLAVDEPHPAAQTFLALASAALATARWRGHGRSSAREVDGAVDERVSELERRIDKLAKPRPEGRPPEAAPEQAPAERAQPHEQQTE